MLLDELVQGVPRLIQKMKLVEKPYVRISKSPQNVVAVKGERVQLHCEANGIPPPLVYWVRNGQTVRQDMSQSEHNVFDILMNLDRKTVQNSNTATELVIDCAAPEDSGTYRCVATNGVEIVNSKATVVVESGLDDQSETKKCKASPAPRIFMWSDFRFEMNGNAVQLFCRPTNYMKNQITWFDPEGNEVKTNDNFEVLKNGDLLIRRGKWDYAGLYTCKAENRFGSDQKQIFYYPTAEEDKANR